MNTYNAKIEEYILKNNIEKINVDPTMNFLKNINNAINKTSNIINKYQKYHSKMIKPSAPKITGLPKIHKQDRPIRPLINFTTSPAYKIAKYMNKWLNDNINIVNDFSVKNNLELVDKIISTKIPTNAKLVSFDVTNMYSNIPIAETIKITQELLIINKIDSKKIDEAINLLNIITNQNYFQHENLFYNQKDGLPMGSPLSGTLANIYLNYFEKTFIMSNENKYQHNILYWYRYVDDILLLFDGTDRQLSNMHNYLNKIHPNIKFTIEKEIHKSINFLDLTIFNQNQSHSFKIFRKPTQTNHTIHKSSHHPYQHKIAAYNHMLNRLNTIPMNIDDYNRELQTIVEIANSNGYTEKLVHDINRKIISKINRHNLTMLNNDQNKNNKYISMNYNEKTSNIVKKVFRQYGYTVAHKTNNTVFKNLQNQNKHINEDSGVYKLTCNDCPKFYIGQTGRNFQQRFNEHIKEVNHDNPKINTKSNFAQHLNNEKHTYTNINENLKILHKMKKGKMMDRREEYAIYKERKNELILNEKINTKTNTIYEYIHKFKHQIQ